MSKLAIEVVHSKSLKSLFTIDKLSASNTIKDVKNQIESQNAKYYPDRQMLRSEATGKPLKDEIKLSDLTLRDGSLLKLYFKDLGPQVGWTTVFMTEYAGPLIIYLIFYSRPWFIYGASAKSAKYLDVVNYACAAWTFHYAKRLFETKFVHRFSHGTMPLRNIFKNSFYYWGFAAYVAYYINHPLYTRASYGDLQIYIGLAGFLFNEIGNLSIHVALRNLRPPGTKERRIPNATSNPFTLLFNLVSCPNYTYEIGSWVFFSIMTQSVPAALFTIAGAYQMVIWALGKHRNYRKEFDKYPRGRKSIIPFVI